MDLPPSVVKLTHVLDELLVVMDREEKAALAGAGVNPSQAKLLLTVAERKVTRLTELSQALGISKSSVSASLENLERLGLLSRWRRPDDRRVYPVQLSDRGRALARQIRQQRAQTLTRAAAELTPYQRKTLASALEALLKAFPRVEGEDGP